MSPGGDDDGFERIRLGFRRGRGRRLRLTLCLTLCLTLGKRSSFHDEQGFHDKRGGGSRSDGTNAEHLHGFSLKRGLSV